MPDPVTRLADTADSLLNVVAAGLAAAGQPVPERQYVAEGPPAYDCEQLVVALVRLYPGLPFLEDPSAPVLKATLLRSATLAVHVVRCIPTLKSGPRGGEVFPTPAELQASGMAVLTDAYVMPTCVVRAWHDGTFLGLCDAMGVRELVPAEPQGGFGGSIMTVDMQF